MNAQKIQTFLYQHRQGLSLMNGAFLALGIGVYFSLPVEPSLWGIGLLSLVGLIVWFFARRDNFARLIFGYVCLFLIGLFVATVRAYVVAAPVIQKSLFETEVSGVIHRVEPKSDGYRITLKDVTVDGITSDKTPRMIRLNYNQKEPHMRVGDVVKGYAYLVPPIVPAEAGAYNFARAAWFMRIGAIGRLVELTEYRVEKDRSALHIWFEDLRSFISKRIQDVLPKETAAITVPIVIGDQGLVSPKQYELYRIAGIIHVLSVSGFHLTLLSLLVFGLIRGGFALIPKLANYVNTKKVAAFLSLLLTLFYLFISGLQIPAVRSFIMIAVFLIAVLFDRSAISLRTAVLAGCAILLIWPESLINSGFQLSFIAVFAMLSLYETLMRYFKTSPYRKKFFYKCWLVFIGSICVSLLASFSTTPYSAYHFNQFAPYSILGNLLTSVLFSFAVMPLLLIAVLLMPFGWDAPFLTLNGYCLDFIAHICEWIMTLPYADIMVPSFDTWGICVITGGFLILFFFQGKIRWIGLPIALIGSLAFLTVAKPDILISEGGKVVAVRLQDGRLSLSDKTMSSIVSDVWLRRNGQNPNTDTAPAFTQNYVKVHGRKIAFSSLTCADADLSILLKYEIGDCPDPVIDPKQLWKSKTLAIFVEKDTIRVESVAQYMGKRPWSEFLLASNNKTDYIGN